jgi:hypothetical protein
MIEYYLSRHGSSDAMIIGRNLTTPENRAFWAKVDADIERIRAEEKAKNRQRAEREIAQAQATIAELQQQIKALEHFIQEQ